MLAEAACKLEGFRYEPHAELFWQQGHSTERDFIYVTTQTLNATQLEWMSEQVGTDRSLLILCNAWLGNANAWPNLTLKKIPNAVLGRCEFGRDDYSLQIASLLIAPNDDATDEPVAAPTAPRRRGRRRAADPTQKTLLDTGDDA
jgi:adenine-specific DNA-methyltransferase